MITPMSGEEAQRGFTASLPNQGQVPSFASLQAAQEIGDISRPAASVKVPSLGWTLEVRSPSALDFYNMNKIVPKDSPEINTAIGLAVMAIVKINGVLFKKPFNEAELKLFLGQIGDYRNLIELVQVINDAVGGGASSPDDLKNG
jgi:hypothetical protein